MSGNNSQPNIILYTILLFTALFGCGQNNANHELDGEKNQLQHSNSPYLLQHADNPVNWYPWGEEAFKKAEREDKPIFLSIGYSTCYWCHVMERKVFMDEEIAVQMNKNFVNIKVDREERPDVDRVYMTAVRALTGGGGWPMSVFLTPDLKPFFGATYIPPEGQGERPGFSELANRIYNAWQNNRSEVIKQANRLTDHIKENSSPDLEPQNVNADALTSAFESFKGRYDAEYGGFGSAPKFPQPSNIDFLLAYYKEMGTKKALEMVEFTLQKMGASGTYDHLGKGFHRYSTDEQWRVPHFEKMLYDQAQLANSYLKGYKITGNKAFAEIARQILDFTNRWFYHPEGGFYSALNAESPPPENPDGEEEEGAYYLWTKSEIENHLPEQQANIFNHYYGVEANGNALKDPHNVFTGKNILYVNHTVAETANHFELSEQKTKKILKQAEETLYNIRIERPKPFLDDKIVLSWNGLMISAYANAYRILDNEAYLEHAEKSFRFIMDTMYQEETGTFKRRFRAGEARFDAHLADYAYFVQGLIDLYHATDKKSYLDYAIRFTDKQNELFYDPENGAFYDTGSKNNNLLVRTKEFYDGARPSGNSVSVHNLVRLAQLTGNEVYAQKAKASIQYFGKYLNQSPAAMPEMLQALTIYLNSNLASADPADK